MDYSDSGSEAKKRTMKRLLSRFANKTSMSGVIWIHEATRTAAKVAWTFLLFAGIGAMAYHLYYLSNAFFLWPSSASLSIGFSSLQLPSITICNANPFKISELNETSDKLQAFVKAVNPQKFIDKSKPPAPLPGRKKRFVDNLDALNMTAYDDAANANYKPKKGTRDSISLMQQTFRRLFMDQPRYKRKRIGHQLSTMLLRCSFAGYECHPGNFTIRTDAHYGNCYTLSASNFQVNEAGIDGGITLIMYLETFEYLPGITEGYGIRVVINPDGTMPFPRGSGIFIDAAHETAIALKQVSISRLGSPYGNCSKSKSSEFESQYGSEYSREGCQAMCIAQATASECDCYDSKYEDAMLYVNIAKRVCRNNEEIACVDSVLTKYHASEISCDCPEPCSETTFVKTVTSRTWPTEDYAQMLLEAVCQKQPDDCVRARAMSKQDLSRNMVKLLIYYEDLNYELIEEQASIENSQFMSDVGGAIGLWIGLSIISLFEVAHLLVDMCFFCCKRKESSKRNDRYRGRPNKGEQPKAHDNNGYKSSVWNSNRSDVYDRPTFERQRQSTYERPDFEKQDVYDRPRFEKQEGPYRVYKGPNY